MKSFVTCTPLGRMGNSLFSAAAALAYSFDHDLRFTMPHETPNKFWKALYLQHLVDPEFVAMEPSVLKRVEIKECGYPFHPLEFKPEWAEDHLIVVDGYRQSDKYFAHHRDRILKAFDFPWGMLKGVVACHVRRGDALRYPTKHKILEPRWYLEAMARFPGYRFAFFSDDLDWCRQNFGNHPDTIELDNAVFYSFNEEYDRHEVRDLIVGAMCEHQICSSSTFSVWQSILNRNPGKRAVAPKLWLVPGWEGTTEETWKDVRPSYFELV